MNIGIAILAAGASTRFGSAKQLANHKSSTLVSHCVEQCRQVRPPCTVSVIVGGPFLDAVVVELADKKVELIPNAEAHSGIASSIKTAAKWAGDSGLGALLLVACDQVLLTSQDYSSLVYACMASNKPICCASYSDSFGIPAIFRRSQFEDLCRLQGDRGAKSLIAERLDDAYLVQLPHAAVDVDEPEDLLTVV
jgi:molybdenum cofactor cytidylyltransferase